MYCSLRRAFTVFDGINTSKASIIYGIGHCSEPKARLAAEEMTFLPLLGV
jgi:hypothetical protein